MIFAVLIRNEQTSILTTTFSALAFFLFSDAVTPLETMPAAASALAALNPFVIAASAFKKVIIFGITEVRQELVMLSIYLAFMVFILWFVVNKRLKE